MRNVPLPSITGSLFLELSQVAGEGCSGSPVLSDAARAGSNWLLAGIYVGERINDRATSVGHAVDAFATWKPKIADTDIDTLVALSRPIP